VRRGRARDRPREQRLKHRRVLEQASANGQSVTVRSVEQDESLTDGDSEGFVRVCDPVRHDGKYQGVRGGCERVIDEDDSNARAHLASPPWPSCQRQLPSHSPLCLPVLLSHPTLDRSTVASRPPPLPLLARSGGRTRLEEAGGRTLRSTTGWTSLSRQPTTSQVSSPRQDAEEGYVQTLTQGRTHVSDCERMSSC
jgi:hypothetical protein